MELRQEEITAVLDAERDAQSIETAELQNIRLAVLGATGLAEVTLV